MYLINPWLIPGFANRIRSEGITVESEYRPYCSGPRIRAIMKTDSAEIRVDTVLPTVRKKPPRVESSAIFPRSVVMWFSLGFSVDRSGYNEVMISYTRIATVNRNNMPSVNAACVSLFFSITRLVLL